MRGDVCKWPVSLLQFVTNTWLNVNFHYIGTCVRTCVSTCVHAYCIYICLYIYTYIYIYIRTYIHKHTQVQFRGSKRVSCNSSFVIAKKNFDGICCSSLQTQISNYIFRLKSTSNSRACDYSSFSFISTSHLLISEAVRTSETSVNICVTTRRCIQILFYLHFYCHIHTCSKPALFTAVLSYIRLFY